MLLRQVRIWSLPLPKTHRSSTLCQKAELHFFVLASTHPVNETTVFTQRYLEHHYRNASHTQFTAFHLLQNPFPFSLLQASGSIAFLNSTGHLYTSFSFFQFICGPRGKMRFRIYKEPFPLSQLDSVPFARTSSYPTSFPRTKRSSLQQ